MDGGVEYPAVFAFASASYAVNEGDGAVTVAVLNSGDLGGSVNFQTADVTAVGGTGSSGDYTISQGSLIIDSPAELGTSTSAVVVTGNQNRGINTGQGGGQLVIVGSLNSATGVS